MQTDAGFIQNIQHAHQTGADLGRQSDALALAPRECPGGPGECQIAEAHTAQEIQSAADFLDDLGRDQPLFLCECQAVQKGRRVHHRKSGEFRNVLSAHRHRQSGLLQALASAGGAGRLRHAGFDLRPHSRALGLAIAPFQIRNNALEFSLDDAVPIRFFIAQLQRLAPGPVKDRIDGFRGQGFERIGELKVILLRHRIEVHLGDSVRFHIPPARGVDAAVFDA